MKTPCIKLGKYCNYTNDCCSDFICYEKTICIHSLNLYNEYLNYPGYYNKHKLYVFAFDSSFIIHFIIFMTGLFLILRFYYISYSRHNKIDNEKKDDDDINIFSKNINHKKNINDKKDTNDKNNEINNIRII